MEALTAGARKLADLAPIWHHDVHGFDLSLHPSFLCKPVQHDSFFLIASIDDQSISIECGLGRYYLVAWTSCQWSDQTSNESLEVASRLFVRRVECPRTRRWVPKLLKKIVADKL